MQIILVWPVWSQRPGRYIVTDAGHAENAHPVDLAAHLDRHAGSYCGWDDFCHGPLLWGDETRALEPGCPSPVVIALQKTRHFSCLLIE